MSLVEQALKKIQQGRASEIAAANEAPARQIESQPHEPTVAPIFPARSIHIDMASLQAAGFIAPLAQERQLAHEYRHIKRPLIANALGRGEQPIEKGNLIMVTSSLPGDGKTFTSINLAMSIALELDLSVLLVDTDVAKRHISRLFGLDKDAGLLDVLRDETLDVESAIIGTDIRGLSVLPAGKPSDTAAELLSSRRMDEIVRKLGASPRRIVLFDSPPLLLTSESRALAASVGQIVLVVCAGLTPQRAVLDSLDVLGEGKSVAVVLNQSDEGAGRYGYGYYGEQPTSASNGAAQ